MFLYSCPSQCLLDTWTPFLEFHHPTQMPGSLVAIMKYPVFEVGKEKRIRNVPRPRDKKREHIPGWRKGQRLPATSIQQSPRQNLLSSEGKVQRPGGEEPGPGRGLPAQPATLTQPAQATPSTTSSVKSEAAKLSCSCLGTWTVSQPKPPVAETGFGKENNRDKACSFSRARAWWSRRAYSSSTVYKGQGGRGAGRESEKEAGLDQLPSPFPLLTRKWAAPPSVGVLLGNSWRG